MNEWSSIGDQPARFLLVHGVIVLFIGVLSGIPFWLAIILSRAKGAVNAWRVAHSTLIVCGLLMLVVSLILPQLALSRELGLLMAWFFIVSGYGFVFALVMGAWLGRRGLTPWPLGIDTVFFVGHFIGATGSLIGIAILIYGLFRAL
jgi:uncharacterized membrane protein